MQVLSAKELSKRYTLGDRPPNSIRDVITAAFRSAGSKAKQEESTIWALRDVSFDLSDGETLGIIGSNGAGKSTLLKILSRITRPTTGRAVIRGRVGSLLEVGTGFHNELSGRENIYLNGAILGMKRVEINKKFDEIVEFSEVERFLDTPLKHYSSGMYTRLAFAVAAHLDPEVLIVDEVLAVGDVAFQKKCLTKMRDIGSSGRTVLFVSHDMNSIARLCGRAIWLNNGRIMADGQTAMVIGEYLGEQSNANSAKHWEPATAPGNEYARLVSARVANEIGETTTSADIRRPIKIEMEYEVLKEGKVMVPNFHFFNAVGTCIFVAHDWQCEWRGRERPIGRYKSTMTIPGNFLAEGVVTVGVALSTYFPLEVHFVEWEALSFNVADTVEGDSARGDFAGDIPGVVRPVFAWSTEKA